jgi:hypothetical protein
MTGYPNNVIKNTNDSWDDTHETPRRIQFITPQKNEAILEEINVDPVEKKLAENKHKWLNHVSRKEYIRYPEQLLYYWRIGRRPERPLKRLLDG